jgi:dsDNA-specific endonuclease/ATPase MutS2
MRTFEQTLERAIAAGEHSLVAIHGVGAGVLKKKILEFCKTHPRIKCCTAPIVNNYGTGATEIFFQ